MFVNHPHTLCKIFCPPLWVKIFPSHFVISLFPTTLDEDYEQDVPQQGAHHAPQHVPDPTQGDGPSRSKPKFIPRRRPHPPGPGYNGHFCSPLLVDVGEKNNDYVEMIIQNNLVSEFEILSGSNSEHRIETGGILNGRWFVSDNPSSCSGTKWKPWPLGSEWRAANCQLFFLQQSHNVRADSHSSFYFKQWLACTLGLRKKQQNLNLYCTRGKNSPAFCLTNVGLEKLNARTKISIDMINLTIR